jgi:hypothetical protein
MSIIWVTRQNVTRYIMIRIRVSIRYEDNVLSDNVSVMTRPMVWVMDGKVKYRMTGIRALGIQSTRLSFQSSELGTPTPSPPRECALPPLSPRGETHSLAGEGVGGPNSDEGTDNLVLYAYYNPSTDQGV